MGSNFITLTREQLIEFIIDINPLQLNKQD
jgi:hypothetical protein